MILGACTAPVTPATTSTVFTVPIPVEAFSARAALQVSIWNQLQLTTLDRQAECVVEHNPESDTDIVHCPAGVTYQEITPEQFVFSIQTIQSPITFTSTSVHAGEKYQIAIRGLNQDGCNSTSASYEGVAQTATISLPELSWETTEMACVPAP